MNRIGRHSPPSDRDLLCAGGFPFGDLLTLPLVNVIQRRAEATLSVVLRCKYSQSSPRCPQTLGQAFAPQPLA